MSWPPFIQTKNGQLSSSKTNFRIHVFSFIFNHNFCVCFYWWSRQSKFMPLPPVAQTKIWEPLSHPVIFCYRMIVTLLTSCWTKLIWSRRRHNGVAHRFGFIVCCPVYKNYHHIFSADVKTKKKYLCNILLNNNNKSLSFLRNSRKRSFALFVHRN